MLGLTVTLAGHERPYASKYRSKIELMKQLINYLFERLWRNLILSERNYSKMIVLQSLLHAKMNRSKDQVNFLGEIEFSGFSQWGEDGIIDWLIEKIPEIPNVFVEFGVEDYRESNTRLLLYLRNWRGLVLDSSADNITNIKKQEISWRYDLQVKHAFIDCENINTLIESSGIFGDIGLLSIDIDGNDYWIWHSIDIVNPVIVICEYNPIFGNLKQITIPYQAGFDRTKAHYSNLYFGASLPALIKLANLKNYVFLGTNCNGSNAFFVRKEHASILVSSIHEIKAFPSLVREARDHAGRLTFARGNQRLEIIQNLPVFDLETCSTSLLRDIGELYSPSWILGK